MAKYIYHFFFNKWMHMPKILCQQYYTILWKYYTMHKIKSRVNINGPKVFPLSPGCQKKAHFCKISHCPIFYFLCLEIKCAIMASRDVLYLTSCPTSNYYFLWFSFFPNGLTPCLIFTLRNLYFYLSSVSNTITTGPT